MGEIEIDMTEFNEVVEILENGKLTKRDHDDEVKIKTAGIAFQDSFFGGDEYREVVDPDSEMDYSKFALQKDPAFPKTMKRLEKYYGDGYADMAIIEPFSGQQPIIDSSQSAQVEEYKPKKSSVEEKVVEPEPS
jgi:hypothetical protein